MEATRRFGRALLCYATFISLSACSGNPGNRDFTETLKQKLQNDGTSEIMSIVSVRKLNGYQPDERTYVAEVEYDLKFKRGLREIVEEGKKNKRKNSRDFDPDAMAAGLNALWLASEYGEFEKGDTITQTTEIRYRKTEQGWRPV